MLGPMLRSLITHSLRLLCITGLGMLLYGCQSQDPPQDPKLRQEVREKIVTEAALSYASKYALYWEAKQTNRHMMQQARMLDQIFDFRAITLGYNLLPPILRESRHNVNAESNTILRVSDRFIEILQPATFMSVIPTWRQYLLLQYNKPEKPNHNLEPKNPAERRVWDQALVQGWNAGRLQASQIFRNHSGILQRDFIGMVLYHQLLAQGMISPSHAATANLGVTGDEKSMQLNDRMVKITAQSKLLPHHTAQWKPALR